MSDPTPNPGSRNDNGASAPAEPWLPEPLHAALERAKSVWSRMPIGAKVLLGAILATGIVVGSYSTMAPYVEERSVLFSQLDQEDAAAIVEKLKAQEIPFTLEGDGTTIEVPTDLVHELRLSLAAEGLPHGGQVGFESFENMRLGATEFEQHVTYRRAMEGELARTITTVRTVKNARVHLVLPRKSVFAQKREPASASVILSLKGKLTDEEVNGIVHLVATAVPELTTDRVALVTTDGQMLHRPRKAGADDMGAGMGEGDRLKTTQALEGVLEERTRTMLERVLGAGHVDVRVRAEIDTAKVETKSDHFDPKQTALRSEQASVEKAAGGDADAGTVAGVPGAESNIPGGNAVVGEENATTEEAGAIRKSHTRNFEVDRVQEKRVSVKQEIRRLAVAVVVDGITETVDGQSNTRPRNKEELKKLTELVKSAVGYDEKRGDVVTVESVPFFNEELPPVEEVPPLLPPEIQAQVDRFLPLAKGLAIFLVGLIGFFWFRRFMKKQRAIAEKRAKALAKANEIKQLEEAAKAAEIAPSANERATEMVDFKVEAISRAKTDPATAALIVRHWLGTATDKTNRENAAA
ncbi:MAG: flagellar basal-body MS-ring/collar protein FliF [Myxococcota bacterium]